MLNRPKITIRATQSVMMSRAVERTLVGIDTSPARASRSGQPRVECGQRAELNQVSRTSGSCTSVWPGPELVAAQVGLGADEPAARLGRAPGDVGAAAEGALRGRPRCRCRSTRSESDGPTRAAG